MHRFVALTLLLVGLAGAWTLTGAPARAQEGTPGAGGEIPPASDCRIAPLSFADLQGLGTPAAAPTTPSGTPVALPAGEPADEATVAGISATVREAIACVNAGDPLRALALYSDAYLRTLMTDPSRWTQAFYDTLSTPSPASETQQRTLVAIRGVRLLPDGRAGTVVVVDDPTTSGETISTTFLLFVNSGDRWLIDGAIEDIVEPTATPAA